MVWLKCLALETYTRLGLIHGKRLSSFSIFLVLAVLFSLSSLSLGKEIEHCYDTPWNDSAEWSEKIAAQMFDPSLGELNGAKITMNITILPDVHASNKGNTSANATIDCGGNLSLALPDNSVLSVESAINRTELLAPTRNLDINESTSKTENLSLDESQLKRFIASSPNETIILPLVAASHISFTADSALMFGVALKTRASVCIVYDYSAAKEQSEGVTGA